MWIVNILLSVSFLKSEESNWCLILLTLRSNPAFFFPDHSKTRGYFFKRKFSYVLFSGLHSLICTWKCRAFLKIQSALVKITLKALKNTLLIKCSVGNGPANGDNNLYKIILHLFGAKKRQNNFLLIYYSYVNLFQGIRKWEIELLSVNQYFE